MCASRSRTSRLIVTTPPTRRGGPTPTHPPIHPHTTRQRLTLAWLLGFWYMLVDLMVMLRGRFESNAFTVATSSGWAEYLRPCRPTREHNNGPGTNAAVANAATWRVAHGVDGCPPCASHELSQHAPFVLDGRPRAAEGRVDRLERRTKHAYTRTHTHSREVNCGHGRAGGGG